MPVREIPLEVRRQERALNPRVMATLPLYRDVTGRVVAQKLSEALGQPIISDNRPGASGNIGSEKVAHAKPDGYTLLVQVSTLVMNGSLYKSLPYDPVADFTPVTLTSWGTLLLVANPQVQKATSVERSRSRCAASSSN